MSTKSTPEEFPLVSAIMLAGRTALPDIITAIACFQAQTYPYKELVIVNNAKSQFDAAALNIQAQRNVALVDTPYPFFAGMARNFGISTANGRILAQFDPDYWYAPNRLESQIAMLASEEAAVVVLASTLQYSYVSGRASYQQNDRNAILGTMVFIRPQNLDYPNIDKQEELGLLQKFQDSGAKIVAMPAPELACKMCYTAGERAHKPVNTNLSKSHFEVVKKIVKVRRGG
jgi:glycosyltransferase involved in cell wall biosynthesis